MKKSGKRLGRRELKRRIRAIVLSSVMTVTMAFSNMAGLYPAVVQAAEITNYFDKSGNNYVPKPDGGAGNTTTLGGDITVPTNNYIRIAVDTAPIINLNGHTINFNDGASCSVRGGALTINDSPSGGKINGSVNVTQGGSMVINGGRINRININSGCSVTLYGGHIDILDFYGDVTTHNGVKIGTVINRNNNYFGVNVDPGDGTGEKYAEVLTASNPTTYELPDCGFTAPENKEFAGWSVSVGNSTETKQPYDSITLTGNTTITATWRLAQTSNTQTTTQTSQPQQAAQAQQTSQSQQTPATTSGSSSSSYDDDDNDTSVTSVAPAATDTTAALANANGTVATPDIALPTYTGRYQPTLTNNTGENPRAGLLTASGQAVFTFKTTSGEDDSFDHFQGAQMDGMTLSPWEYNVTRGSTIITLTKDVINSLDDGAHTLTMIFDDEVVTVPFTKAGLLKSSPKMGED